MRKKLLIWLFLCLPLVTFGNSWRTAGMTELAGITLPAEISSEGDTVGLVSLRHVIIYPKMHFKNKRQERFFWRTVRDVKKTLPYAKIIAREMTRVDSLMVMMTPRQRTKFWKDYERLLFQQYERDFRRMTASQGQMLMKLVDRETSYTSYQVIQMYKGSFTANFWQGIAKLFGNDLKEDYDGTDKDKIVERIIVLVEAGQL